MSETAKPATGETIRSVQMPKRGPVTRETVRELERDEKLAGVARIALKYVKK